MQGNILLTKCMDSESISLEIIIGMREPGMREEGKDLVYIHSGPDRQNLVIGKMGFLTFHARNFPILNLPMLSTIPKFLMQCRYLCFFFPCGERIFVCHEKKHENQNKLLSRFALTFTVNMIKRKKKKMSFSFRSGFHQNVNRCSLYVCARVYNCHNNGPLALTLAHPIFFNSWSLSENGYDDVRNNGTLL